MHCQNRERSRVSRWLFVISLVFALLASTITFASIKSTTTNAGKVVPMIGLNARDATITDMNGGDVTNATKLSNDFIYTLTYHWRVPDQTIITAGDVAQINLPATVAIQTDLSFPVKDPKTDATIGKFSAKAGSQTALLTFTDFFSHSTVGRSGILTFSAEGTYDDHEQHHVGWYIAKAGWTVMPPTNASAAEKAQYVDSLGRPKVLQWEITVNPQMVKVNHLVLDDTLGSGQTFDATRKIQVATGSYSSQGAFHQTGTMNPDYQINGNQIKINLGNIDQTIRIDLWTNPTPESFAQTTIWTNQVAAEGKNQGDGLPTNATGKIVWTNSGSGDGKIGQVTLTKRDQDHSKKTLSNAVFALYRANHTLVHANLTTDAHGQLTVRQLLAGDYYFVETQAPSGYKRNQTPIPFTINTQHPQVTVQAKDKATTPPPVKPSASKPSASVSSPATSSSKRPSVPSKPSEPSSSASKSSTSSHKVPSKPSDPSSSVSKPSASEPSSPAIKSSTPSHKVPSKPSEPSSSVSKPSASDPKVPSKSSVPSVPESKASTSDSKVPSTSSASYLSTSKSSTSDKLIDGVSHNKTNHHLPDTYEQVETVAAIWGSLLFLASVIVFVKFHK